MRVLITGGTGFLGNNIVRSLLDNGHTVTAAIRHSSDPRPLNGLGVETIKPDLLDASDVNHAIGDSEMVIHSAAHIHVGWNHFETSHQVNVESTRLIAESARRKKIRMIHVSTVDALAALDSEVALKATVDELAAQWVTEDQLEPPKVPCAYVVSKRCAELEVLKEVEFGLDGVIVNPGFMVGPWDWKPSSGKMMLTLAKIPLLYFAPGGGCSVVDVRDVADGIVSAMEHARTGERYILGGQNMSYLELWKLMADVMNKRPPVRKMRNWLAATVGKTGDLVGKLSKRESDLNSAATQMGQMFHWYSSQKAERELGYRIGSVEDALRDAWDWFKKYEYV